MIKKGKTYISKMRKLKDPDQTIARLLTILDEIEQETTPGQFETPGYG